MGSGCNNKHFGKSSFSYSLSKGCNSCTDVNTDDVMYTGGDASCISIPSNVSLTQVITLLGQAICGGGVIDPDYSGYDTACLVNDENSQIQTRSEFVKSISSYVCLLRSDVDAHYLELSQGLSNLEDQVNNDKLPALTSCPAVGIVPQDNINSVLTKLIGASCDLYTQLDPSAANWNTCYTVTPPTTIVAGFNAVLTMICDLKGTISSGPSLPVFDNTGSCLASPVTDSDTLVVTINKIKDKLCSVPDFIAGNINFGCLAEETSLQDTVQSLVDNVIDLKTNIPMDWDTDYFTVTPLSPGDVCQGVEVTLNTSLLDRYVSLDNSDNNPGYLLDKIKAGDNILFDTSTPGEVTISSTVSGGGGSADSFKLKTSAGDPTEDYLMAKLDTGNDTGINLSLTHETSGSSYKAKITPVIDFETFAGEILTAIENDPTLLNKFCSLVAGCAVDDTQYYNLSITNTYSDTIHVIFQAEQSNPSVVIANTGTAIAIDPDDTYVFPSVPVSSANTPIGGGFQIISEDMFDTHMSYMTRENNGNIVASSTSGGGFFGGGNTIVINNASFWGTSPDNYNFNVVISATS